MTPIAPLITAFLRVGLAIERGTSQHTCDTYAYAFKLLFEFTGTKLNLSPSKLCLEHISAPLVLSFLENIKRFRNNSPVTRNSRLAAIKSFMRFVEYPSCRILPIRSESNCFFPIAIYLYKSQNPILLQHVCLFHYLLSPW